MVVSAAVQAVDFIGASQFLFIAVSPQTQSAWNTGDVYLSTRFVFKICPEKKCMFQFCEVSHLRFEYIWYPLGALAVCTPWYFSISFFPSTVGSGKQWNQSKNKLFRNFEKHQFCPSETGVEKELSFWFSIFPEYIGLGRLHELWTKFYFSRDKLFDMLFELNCSIYNERYTRVHERRLICLLSLLAELACEKKQWDEEREKCFRISNNRWMDSGHGHAVNCEQWTAFRRSQ